MKGNKNRELKKRLERELPYPRLTLQADLRFDQILAALPEREKLQKKAGNTVEKRSVSQGPAHYKKEQKKKRSTADLPPEGIMLPEGMEYFEPVPFRRSWPKTILQCAAALALFSLVCLTLLNVALPEIAENLPGFGGMFQTINGRLRPAPTEEPPVSISEAPMEAPYKISVESAVRKQEYLFLTVRLDFTEESCPETDQLFTSLHGESGTEVSIGGRSAVLYRDPVFERIESEPAFRGTVISVLDGEGGNQGALTIHRLLGVTGEKRDTVFEEMNIDIAQTVSCEISAQSEYCYNNNDDTAPITVNNVSLMGYSSTESEFWVTVSYPRMNEVDPYIVVRPAGDGNLGELSANTYGEDGKLGELMGQEICFEAVPEGMREVLVTVYTQEPGNPRFYVDGSMIGAAVLAEFCIDLETNEIISAADYLDSGFQYVGLPYYSEVWEAGFRFRDHVLPMGWEQSFADFSENIEAGKNLYLTVLSDLDLEFPLQLETYLYGELLEELPLYYSSSVSTSLEREEGLYCNEGRYGSVTVSRREGENSLYGTSHSREYAITLYNPGIEQPWDLEHNGYYVVLRNLRTGEVLAGSTMEEDLGNINANMNLIGTQEELTRERPVFYDPSNHFDTEMGAGMSTPSPIPDVSSTPLEKGQFADNGDTGESSEFSS